MNDKVKKLISEYKQRVDKLTKRLNELQASPVYDEQEIQNTKLARILWRQVIQDLEKIVR